jgi:hypothetical protein
VVDLILSQYSSQLVTAQLASAVLFVVGLLSVGDSLGVRERVAIIWGTRGEEWQVHHQRSP